MIKVSIIGCGRVFNHYDNILKSKKINDFKIVQICDKKKSLAKKISKIYNCNFYEDYKQMINESNGSDRLIV